MVQHLRYPHSRGAREVEPHDELLMRTGGTAAELQTLASSAPRAEAPPPASAAPARRAQALDLSGTAGFLVVDAHGRVVGRVEGPPYGSSEEIPDALSVRSSLRRWRRHLVPTTAIEAIDEQTRVIGLRIDRDGVQAFL